MSDDLDNVIAIDPEAEAELAIIKKKRAELPCGGRCIQVMVDEHRRMLTCRKCGATIDPFDYMLYWAREGDHRMSGLRGIEAKRRVAYAEFTKLEAAIDSIRGKLKRAGAPQSEADRSQYRNDLANAEWQAATPRLQVVK